MLKSIRRTLGFTLIELSIVMFIGTMSAMGLLWLKTSTYSVEKASEQGKLLATLSNAVATYMTNNYTQLVNNTAIPGYANIYAPTIAELNVAGTGLSNFNPLNNYGGGYTITITRTPAGCTPPACDLVSMTALTNAITSPLTGFVDGKALGQAASTIGANAGFSTAAAPGTITGVGAAWTMANPAGAVAGILGMRAGYNSSGMGQFLRRDGTLPMTNALNAGGFNVNNVATLNSTAITNTGNAIVGGTLGVTGQTNTNGLTNTGALTNTGNASVGGTLGVVGQTTTAGITNNGAITNTGALTTGSTTVNGTATISGNTNISGNTVVSGSLGVSGLTTTAGINNTGNITNTGDVSTGRVKLTAIVANGSSCAGLNGYQAATAAGSIASCINGVWSTPNTATAPPPPCPSQAVTWGNTSGCSATLPATPSGSSSTATANAPHSGSASFVCTNGSWVTQPGASCSMACSAQTLSWSSGCQASFPASSGSTDVTRSATNSPYTGTATFTCQSSNGTWQLNSSYSNTCNSPQPCSGSVSWGNGNCSGSYSIASGSGQSVYSSTSNSWAGYNLNGTISGSAYVSCNNGSVTVSSKSCNYSGSTPRAYNQNGDSQAPYILYIVSDAVSNYCGHMLGTGTSAGSYSTQPCPDDNAWFTWSNRVTSMTWTAQVNGSGCSANGCSCWAYRNKYGTYANTVTSLSCNNNN